ncbi:MAG TPA: hypothetical protein VH643_18670 [Gemmataceae bacterium]|jgi:hypothetical protein
MPKRPHPPPLTVKQILTWAKAHRIRTGRWPHAGTGPIRDAPQETWRGVNSALMKGHRGLPGGSSLFKLLKEHCGHSHEKARLTVGQVLTWMECHRRRTGRWPVATSGTVLDAPRENWLTLDAALRHGSRGLPAGLSLRHLRVLLAEADLA